MRIQITDLAEQLHVFNVAKSNSINDENESDQAKSLIESLQSELVDVSLDRDENALKFSDSLVKLGDAQDDIAKLSEEKNKLSEDYEIACRELETYFIKFNDLESYYHQLSDEFKKLLVLVSRG